MDDDGGGWTVIQRYDIDVSDDSSEIFNATWKDYVEGFEISKEISGMV